MTTSARSWSLVAVMAWLIAVLLIVVPLLLLALGVGNTSPGSTPLEVLESVAFLLVSPVYAVTSALIVSRQSRNAVGWMLMAIALGMTLAFLGDTLTPVQPPADVSLWLALLTGLASVSWVFFIYPVFHLLLTFPTGRVLSPPWRALVVLEVLMVAFMMFAGLFGEELVSTNDTWKLENPIGFIPGSLFDSAWFGPLWNGGLLLLTAGGLLSMTLRFRRSRSVERLQIKWLLFAVALFAFAYGGAALGFVSEEVSLVGILFPISLVGIGLSIAFALLRYRLYDIDNVISRTVTYAVVVGLLALLFFGLIAIVGTRVSEKPLFVAASTLAAAALFNPLRRRVQRRVDRRFNRSRYDTEQVMDEFAASLQDRIEPDGVVDGWVGVVSETMEPAAMGVWLR